MFSKNSVLKQWIWAAAISILFAGNSVMAATWTIKDNYIGKYYIDDDEDDFAQRGGDIISAEGYEDEYEVNNMKVDIDSNGNITVTVSTDYLEPGDGDTYFGDLFISTKAWSPYGNEPYVQDTYLSGSASLNTTNWEYVFDTSAVSFYNTSDGSLLMSEDLNSDPQNWYRKHQLVQFDNTNATAISTSSPTPLAFDTSTSGYLIYSGFNLSDLGGLSLDQDFDLAFRWTMTCANDAIEGDIHWQAVPEPGTMMLLGMGLLGLGAAGRRTLKPERKS